MTGTVAITMAGMGSRFTNAGYTRPKYEIEVFDRPLFDWSMLSLNSFRDAGYRFMFLTRSGLGAQTYIEGRARALQLGEFHITSVDGLTNGQATSAYILARRAAPEDPFAVYNIDTFVDPATMLVPSRSKLDGWIPCFPAPGDGWSFARTDDAGQVVEIREKQRISDHATVGLYWFASAADFCNLYDTYYAIDGREEKGERYVAPLYNQIIADGGRVEIASLDLDDVGMLGTPEQVDQFAMTPPRGAQRFL